MNINDVKDTNDIPDNIWKAIFDKQMELAVKYKDIENMGDLLDTTDMNINTAKGQKWIKDFAWRTTEELAEAYETKDYEIVMASEELEVLEQHFKEELIDALHFLTELTIIAGYNYEFVEKQEIQDYTTTPWDTVYYLGLMCNTLKNKPWKQTQMLTDRKKFEQLLGLTWASFILLLRNNIGDEIDIYQYYFKKQAVNKFRQRSKY